MSFRTIVIKSRCKLEYSLNYLVYRGEQEYKINLDEISTIVIQSTQVSLTSALLAEIISRNIKLIACDHKQNPVGEMVPYYGTYNSREVIMSQLSIDQSFSDIVWKMIIEQKIKGQRKNLEIMELDQYTKLLEYEKEISIGDKSNREGHAAKVYFNALFGNDFSRSLDNNTNKFLNYGYSILLSAINRTVQAHGFLSQIGFHHIGQTNPFNLSCDLIEPLRPLVDYYVISGKATNDNYKMLFVEMLSKSVTFNNKNMILENAINDYVEFIMGALINKDLERVCFIEYERV